MARIKHYNSETTQWEYSDISDSVQQGSSIDYEEVNNLINAAVENKADKSSVLPKAGGSMSGDIYMEGNGIVGTGTVGFNAQNADGDSISVLTLQPVLSGEDNSVYLYLQDEYNGYHTVGIQNVASPIEDNDAATKGYVDEAISGFSTEIYGLGTTPPSNTKLLWIDTTANTGGLKYYNGSSWVHVPVAYT